MIPIKAIPGKLLALGVRGENKARQVMIPISDWVAEYGAGTAAVYHKRNGDNNSYPVTVTVEDGVVIWPLTSTDTDKAGYGNVELQYVVGDVVVKTSVWQSMVTDCLSASGETPEPGEDWEASITLIKNAAETAQAAAEAAQADAEAAQRAAETAQAAADQSKADAEAAEATAIEKAGDAATSAADALAYKEAAETAKTAAEAAQAATVAAKEAAESAQAAAEAAKADAEVAQSAAETAEGNAQTYASSAGNYASAALTAKQTAVSAKDASVAAKVSAEGAASAAITAKNAAETAKAAAETAKEAAETAQTAAEAAQMAAETAKTDSIEAKTAAETAAANALTYKEAAETAKTAAEAAQAAAEAIDAYTKAEADNRFYPLGACNAKKSGTIVTIDDALPLAVSGLKLYGKTIQDGTPTPEAPVPLQDSLTAQNGAIVQLAVSDADDVVQQTLDISSIGALRGIPVSSGGNVTIDGQQYVADTDTWLGGTSWRRDNYVGVKVFDGTENIAKNDASSYLYYYASLPHDSACAGVCTHFTPYAWATAVDSYSLINSARSIYINFFGLIDTNNAASAQAYLAAQYANGTPVTVYYALTTPTSELFTGPDLSTLTTLDGTTNIITQNTDIAPYMDITYRPNLLTKIDELATAIVALGGTI